jgi:hypothetical protein
VSLTVVMVGGGGGYLSITRTYSTVPVLEDDCSLVIVVGNEMVHRIPHDIYVHRLQHQHSLIKISNLFDLNYKGKEHVFYPFILSTVGGQIRISSFLLL